MDVLPLAVPGLPAAAEGESPGERAGESALEFAALLAMVGAPLPAPPVVPPPETPATVASGSAGEPADALLPVVLPAAAPVIVDEPPVATSGPPRSEVPATPDSPPEERAPAPPPVLPATDHSPEVAALDHLMGGKTQRPRGDGAETSAPVPPLAPSPPPPAPVSAATTVQPPAPSVPAPSIPEQVVAVVAPLRHRGDGAHEVTLELRPAELGTIRVEVILDQGTVHLSLQAHDDSTAQLLRHSIPELRVALEEAGLAAGRFGVGSGDGHGRSSRHPTPDRADEAPSTPTRTAVPAAATGLIPPRGDAGAVDLLL